MLREYSIADMLPALPEQTLYYACSLEAVDHSHLEWPHKHGFYSFVWFVNGNGFNVVDFTEYAIYPHRLFLVSPEQIHNWAYHENTQGYVLMFDKMIAAHLGIDFLSPYMDININNAPLLQLVVENLISRQETKQLDYSESNSTVEINLLYFYSLIVNEINDSNFDLGGMNVTFREFKELILSNEFKNQSIDGYADTLHISTAELNSICQNFAGSSAKQFLLDLKITEAKRLLIYTQLNVSDISYELGFEDASYFARIFKKKTTLSPTAFLGKYRK